MADQLPFINASPIRGNHGKKTKANKGKTVAERITWMTRTSDVVGSFHNTSAEESTTLIRRKIQERCGSTQELMATIRRLKTGDTGHVTPGEFRLTLIKFGISIPQALVDTIFNLFDSDRSGTIDFDEFAMWIMNSEFRPVKKEKPAFVERPEEVLRKKLRDCMTQYPEVFATMKKKISFLDLSADIVRKNMPMTEKDGRGLFKILDPSNVGVIDSIKLKRFAFDGITETPPPSAKPFVKPDLNESVFKICGRHTNLLLDCFSNYDPNTAMEFDEFKRALLSNNLGLNQKDAYNLFLALDGKDGKCNLRILIDNIQPMPVDPACQPSVKPKKPSYIPQSRADRRLRDAIRKCYKQLKQTFEMVDKENTGFVNPNLFCRILNGLVLPLNYEDFRFMMRNVPSDDAGSYNYRYFLALYDPNSAPHELSGVASTTLLADHTFGDSKPMNGSHSPIVRSDSPMQKSASASGMLEGHNSNGAERASAELKRMWQSALRACKAQDSDKSGFVSRSVFTSALETHLGKVMNAEAINSLANSYAMGEDIDYHTCFRTCLNNVMNNGNFITSKSTFQMAPVTKSRPVGATHPWDFKYSKPVLDASVSAIQPSQNNCEKPPYWKRACVQPRSRPSTSAQPMSLDSSVGFNKTAPAALSLEGYEPKIIAVARKVAAHPQYFQFKNELKRAQLVNHRGCVSVRNFNAILAMHNIELSKHELGAVMRVFRSKGMADTITFKDFIDVCAAARAQEV